MSQAIRDAVHAKLVSVQTDPSVWSLVGGRIYEGSAPQSASLSPLKSGCANWAKTAIWLPFNRRETRGACPI